VLRRLTFAKRLNLAAGDRIHVLRQLKIALGNSVVPFDERLRQAEPA
jgi:hypothetical protein